MSDEKKKQMPKGGRKGGRQFPQISLKDATEYAKKLVSKTHTGTQPAAIVLKGVFDNSGGTGQVRASAMKQYGLMDGTADAYEASDLAKKLVSAPPEEQTPLLREAFLKPAVFNTLYETFKGDTVSAAKIRQQAANLDVHPDNLDKCVALFIESAESAETGRREGDGIAFVAHSSNQQPNSTGDTPTEKDDEKDSPLEESKNQNPLALPKADATLPVERTPSGRSVIHVNIGLDSSLDTEKLEKQLELLRRYGAI